ncbi:hypothetical protein [Kocuria kalidii]|uniref:hypothetical protein n=1 Tax=Kocuria kalidii TaxID=3376283 RepID=UPI0037BA9B20
MSRTTVLARLAAFLSRIRGRPPSTGTPGTTAHSRQLPAVDELMRRLPMDAHVQARGLSDAMQSTGVTLDQLWASSFGLGGNLSRFEVEGYLHAVVPLPLLERDVLAHAHNELTEDLPDPARAPYSWTRDP